MSRLLRRFFSLGEDSAYVYSEAPLDVNLHSLPQPDLVVVEPPDVRYAQRHPTAAETLLVVEVCDSTVAQDRRIKMRFYARAGIREAWMVNIPAVQLEVYRQPVDGKYRLISIHGRGEPVSPLAFPDLEVDIADLVPAEGGQRQNTTE